MCAVIDANSFGSVFNPHAKNHSNFGPIRKWITDGDGKMVYGGKKYNAELRGGLYTRILVELDRKGRLVKIPNSQVDKVARELKKTVPDKDFDDEHVVALVALSRCCVVCTDDKRSIRFLKRKDLYPEDVKPPKIYNSKKHASLCCNKHVVGLCR